jgi:hypothetical protein
MNSKFCSFVLLGLIYAPSKLITNLLGNNPAKSLNILLAIKIFLASMTIICWRFLQKRISFTYGSRVAFFYFLFEVFNWSMVDQSSRFVENNLIRSLCMVSFGLLLEKKFLLSIGLVFLSLPIMKDSSLSLLSSLLPLFLNREIFELDPVALFSYLSVSGVVMSISTSFTNFDWFSGQHNQQEFTYSSLLLMISIIPILFGLIWRNFVILKYSLVHCLGLFLFKSQFIHFSFISLAWSITISQLAIHPAIHRCFVLIYSLIFAISGFKSTKLSPAGWASLQFSEILLDDANNCPESIKTHISKTAQSLGFSKFSELKHPKLSYEFATVYSETEMLQKFKYRVADINENIDPAYWKVKFVYKGMENIDDPEATLKVKILSRIQASD